MNIFTIDARDYIIWDMLIKYQDLSSIELNQEIISWFNILQNELKSKGLKYQDFKNMLIPQKSKQEIALVFDTNKIDDMWYGREILYKLLPTLYDLGNHSISTGDLIADNKHQKFVFSLFQKYLVPYRDTIYQNSGQYYLVYINNLTEAKIEKIIESIKMYTPFIGFFNFTYGNSLKTIVASVIGQRFLVMKNLVIVAAIDEEMEYGTEHNLSYDFEKFGFSVICIGHTTYSSFLSYKIECEVFPNSTDTQVSISAISQEYNNLYDFNILIEDKKFEYLMKEKTGSLSRLENPDFNLAYLENLIKSNLARNYIYNLDFNSNYQVSKFNIILELPIGDNQKFEKFLVSLEYIHDINTLRLITMY